MRPSHKSCTCILQCFSRCSDQSSQKMLTLAHPRRTLASLPCLGAGMKDAVLSKLKLAQTNDMIRHPQGSPSFNSLKGRKCLAVPFTKSQQSTYLKTSCKDTTHAMHLYQHCFRMRRKQVCKNIIYSICKVHALQRKMHVDLSLITAFCGPVLHDIPSRC